MFRNIFVIKRTQIFNSLYNHMQNKFFIIQNKLPTYSKIDSDIFSDHCLVISKIKLNGSDLTLHFAVLGGMTKIANRSLNWYEYEQDRQFPLPLKNSRSVQFGFFWIVQICTKWKKSKTSIKQENEEVFKYTYSNMKIF